MLDAQNIAKAFDAGIRSETFYDLRNREIWHHLRTMEAAGNFIDLVTVTQFIHGKGELESVGGPTYLNGCLEQAPVASNIDAHVKVLIDKWTLRSSQ